MNHGVQIGMMISYILPHNVTFHVYSHWIPTFFWRHVILLIDPVVFIQDESNLLVLVYIGKTKTVIWKPFFQ